MKDIKQLQEFMRDPEVLEWLRRANEEPFEIDPQHWKDLGKQLIKENEQYEKMCRNMQIDPISGKFIISKYPDDSYIFDDHEIEDIILSHTNDKHVKTMVRNLLSRRD